MCTKVKILRIFCIFSAWYLLHYMLGVQMLKHIKMPLFYIFTSCITNTKKATIFYCFVRKIVYFL